jgi:hypothetical protein
LHSSIPESGWDCPLCLKSLHEDERLDHLQQDHELVPCDVCVGDGVPNNDHWLSQHLWYKCPFPECIIVEQRNLRGHLHSQHHFQRCALCPQRIADFPSATEHMRHHIPNRCCVCNICLSTLALEDHLILEHDWIECPHCYVASCSQEDFKAHTQEHQVQTCAECSQLEPASRMVEHLLQKHSYLRCSLCSVVSTQLDMVDHVQQCHQRCCVCNFVSDKEQVRHHVNSKHEGHRCRNCTTTIPESLLNKHSNQSSLSTSIETAPELVGRSKLKCTFCRTAKRAVGFPVNIDIYNH